MEDVAITRIMPNSLEAEQSVVGSMIMDKQAIITAGEMLELMIFTITSMVSCFRPWLT